MNDENVYEASGEPSDTVMDDAETVGTGHSLQRNA